MTHYEMKQLVQRQAGRGVDAAIVGLLSEDTERRATDAQIIKRHKSRIVDEIMEALPPYYSITRKPLRKGES